MPMSKASMPTKCIDQMPPPIASADPATHGQREPEDGLRMRAPRSRAV